MKLEAAGSHSSAVKREIPEIKEEKGEPWPPRVRTVRKGSSLSASPISPSHVWNEELRQQPTVAQMTQRSAGATAISHWLEAGKFDMLL